MKTRDVMVLAAFTALLTGSQLLRAMPAASTPSMERDRQQTRLAAQLLKDTVVARTALIHGNVATAEKELGYALAVRKNMARIARGQQSTMVVPIYVELGNRPQHAQWILLDHSTSLVRGAMAYNLRVAGKFTPGQITYRAIDLDKTESRLKAARLAIRDESDAQAERLLADVRFETFEGNNAVDIPLLATRRELSQARSDLASKQLVAASADLTNAYHSLQHYSNGAHTAAAHKLASEIRALQPLSMHNRSSASAKINAWWISVTSWFSHQYV